jgi:hypothetical protein
MNGYLSRNASSCDLKVKTGRPGGECSLQDKSPFLNLWSQALICDKFFPKHRFIHALGDLI